MKNYSLQHLCKSQEELKAKSDTLISEAKEIRNSAKLQAEENVQYRLRLDRWYNTLKSANEKLVAMKDTHTSAKGKVLKSLSIIEKKHPDSSKHFRYLGNKIKELSESYVKARKDFDYLYSK